MAGRFTVESIFKGIDRVTKPVKNMSKSVGKFTRRMSNNFRKLNRTIQNVTASAKTAGLGIAAGLLIAGTAMAGVVDIGADFEQSLVNAAAKMPEFKDGLDKTSESFLQLKKVARDTGRETEFSASAAAEGLNFLAMAGFNVEQSIKALPGLVDLATASTLDLGRAADIASDTLGAFGLSSEDATERAKNLKRVNDVLALATVRTNTSMEDLFEAVKKGGPTFEAAGQSMESFVALSGVMANSGVKGSEAGTILRNTILRLADPTSEAGDLLEGMGVKVEATGKKFRNILDIMQDFEEGSKDMGKKQKLAALSVIFGIRSVTGLSVQLKKGTASIGDFRKELEGAEGAAGSMAGMMRDTTRGAINTMKSSFESLNITIFDTNEKGINKIIEGVTVWIRKVEAFIEANKKMVEALSGDLLQTIIAGIKIFALFVVGLIAIKTALLVSQAVILAYNAGLLLLNISMIAFKGVMLLVAGAQWALNAAMKANPVLAVISLVVGLIAVGALLIANWDKVKAFFIDTWDSIVNKVKSSVESISGLISAVTQPFSDLTAGVSGIKSKITNFIGFGGDSGGAKSQVVSPGERMSKSISESRETSRTEVTLKDETGRAEITKQRGKFQGLTLQQSGAFN